MLNNIAYGVGVALRSGATPFMMGLRWADKARRARLHGIPEARRDWRLFTKVALDEFFLASELASASIISPAAHRRQVAETAEARALYRERGWLRDPARFHVKPAPLEPIDVAARNHAFSRYSLLRYASGYAPHPDEPGLERWQAFERNHVAHARLLEHPGEPRPWIVCVPGYRMGRFAIDYAGFDLRHLHHRLGLNVAIPILPFHGPRGVGRRGGDGFLSGDFIDTIHAQSQAVSDIRQLIHWLRDDVRAPQIGLYGVSLGGYTTGLLAGLEPELDCVVAGIPAADFMRLLRLHVPGFVLKTAEWAGFPFDDLEEILRVISPLAIAPVVPRERLFLYAATDDRLTSPDHARDLWHHWNQPKLRWYEGGHVSFMWQPEVTELVEEALESTGLLAAAALRKSA